MWRAVSLAMTECAWCLGFWTSGLLDFWTSGLLGFGACKKAILSNELNLNQLPIAVSGAGAYESAPRLYEYPHDDDCPLGAVGMWIVHRSAHTTAAPASRMPSHIHSLPGYQLPWILD